jgi:hypothetical protein
MKVLNGFAGMLAGLLVVIVGIPLLAVPPVGIGVIAFGLYIAYQSTKNS